MPLNFHPYTKVTTLEGGGQIIAQGPVAALEFIKNLGTNGGGFFNANGAHPYENPTPLSNVVEMLAIAVLPAAFVNTFGRMTNRPRDARVIFSAMMCLFVAGLLVCDWAERRGVAHRSSSVPRLARIDGRDGGRQHGGQGDAVRRRRARCSPAITTSNGATGSYNSMHDSYRPLGGAVLLANMLLGEIVFGGLGTGLYSVILVALVGLFLAGLMIGRKPEFLGKEIGIRGDEAHHAVHARVAGRHPRPDGGRGW